jgi:hypothetical protein
LCIAEHRFIRGIRVDRCRQNPDLWDSCGALGR